MATTCPEDPRHATSRAEQRPKIRVLLAAFGWPSGLLDVGSWAHRSGLARVVICPVEPGMIFRLPEDDAALLLEGPASDELRETFALQGHPLAPAALVRRIESGTWEIADSPAGCDYRVLRVAENLEVFASERMGRHEVLERLHCLAASTGHQRELFRGDRVPSRRLYEALSAIGIRLAERLLQFRPHVVGFRLEGDQTDRVRRAVLAVRTLCDAEIVLGGPTATSHPIEVLEQLGADYLFAGEAEQPFVEFLAAARQINSKHLAANIAGLTYRFAGHTYFNTLPTDGYQRSVLDDGRLPVQQVKVLRQRVRPIASAELLAENRLQWSLLEGFDRCRFDSLFFTGGRGCPGVCSFCARLHGAEVRAKSAEQLIEEIAAADRLVRQGRLGLSRWRLFEHVDDASLRGREVAWAAVYDEDFFLLRRRAVEFFRLWERSPLRERYRLSFQTNPCSLLAADGSPDKELFAWIDRLKPMIQLGAESFHPQVLARWHKRHNVAQLESVLCALDATRQDYTVFQLLTDFESTAEELLDVVRLLALAAFRHRRMRIASSPFTIPLYDADVRKRLEFAGLLGPDRVRSFEDYQRPQPEWMDPLTARLADLADAELRFALYPPQRDAAVLAALEAVVECIRRECSALQRGVADSASGSDRRLRGRSGNAGGWATHVTLRIEQLRHQAEYALEQVREASFRAGAAGPAESWR